MSAKLPLPSSTILKVNPSFDTNWKLLLDIFSPYTCLGIDSILILSPEPVGKTLRSTSKVPNAAVDCSQLKAADADVGKDPVK